MFLAEVSNASLGNNPKMFYMFPDVVSYAQISKR